MRNLARAALIGGPLLNVEATWNLKTNLVSATVSDGQATAVELWCTTGLTYEDIMSLRKDADCNSVPKTYKIGLPDTRYAKLSTVEMEQVGDHWTGTPPLAQGEYELKKMCIVRAVQGIDGGVATSLPLFSQPLCEDSLLTINENIEGEVWFDGAGLRGVTIESDQPGQTTTEATGYFSIFGALGSPLAVRPTLEGYTFSPPSAAVVIGQTKAPLSFIATLTDCNRAELTDEKSTLEKLFKRIYRNTRRALKMEREISSKRGYVEAAAKAKKLRKRVHDTLPVPTETLSALPDSTESCQSPACVEVLTNEAEQGVLRTRALNLFSAAKRSQRRTRRLERSSQQHTYVSRVASQKQEILDTLTDWPRFERTCE